MKHIDWQTDLPKENGTYIVTTRYDKVKEMNFTCQSGWNTHVDSEGVLHDDHAMGKEYVRGWIPYPQPMPNPEEITFPVEWGYEE